jgi:hypothetical protein
VKQKSQEEEETSEKLDFIGKLEELVTETKKLKPDEAEKKLRKVGRKPSVKRAGGRTEPQGRKEGCRPKSIEPIADSDDAFCPVESLIKNPESINSKVRPGPAERKKRGRVPRGGSKGYRGRNNSSLHRRRKPPIEGQQTEETISRSLRGKTQGAINFGRLHKKSDDSDERSSSTSEMQETAAVQRDDSSNYEPDCERLKGKKVEIDLQEAIPGIGPGLKKQPSEFRLKVARFQVRVTRESSPWFSFPLTATFHSRETKKNTATQTKEMGTSFSKNTIWKRT